MVDLIIDEGIELSKHVFGNYVMQHILEHGTPVQKHRLCRMLEPVAHILCLDPHACAVIGKALSHGSPEDRASIARSLLRAPGLLTTIARTRHGHITATLVLQVSEGKQLAEAQGELANNVELLRASRYGRVVIACLDLPRGSQRAGGA
jgi:pumilio RNA-binding family